MSAKEPHHALDQLQFEKLFKAHFQQLCNFARQYVEDLDTAKDIVQKIYIHLWENRAKIDTRKSIVSYLFTSVKNRCLNHIRDHKKYRSHILDIDCGDLDLSFEDEDAGLPELSEKIAKALDQLPEKCRQVFEMSKFQGMKYKEIAEELELSPKTVEAHMSRAMKGLRKELGNFLWILFTVDWLAQEWWKIIS